MAVYQSVWNINFGRKKLPIDDTDILKLINSWL